MWKEKAKTIFVNPNEPSQPAPGVYRWYFVDANGEKITFYVGEAGKRERRSVRAPSTLARGISEAQRVCISSDKGISLDTDFIVGTAIAYLKEQGHDCYWEHLPGRPEDEKSACDEHQSKLQDPNARILACLRLPRVLPARWTSAHEPEARESLYREFARIFGSAPTTAST